MPRWVDYIPGMHKRILAQRFGPNDSQIVSAIADPAEAINRGGEWFRHNVSQAGGGDPYDNPNPLIGPSRSEQAEAGMNIAGLAQVGNMPGAPSSAGGTLGTFIGPKAATWDKHKAQLAEQMLDAGADPRLVWKYLAVGKMPGGHLFSEIDDSAALLNIGKGNYLKNPDIKNNVAGNYLENKSSGILKHDELYKNYPAINNADVTLKEYGQRGAGQYNNLGDNDFIAISGAINKRPVSKAFNDGPYSLTQAEADEINASEALLGDWRIHSPESTKSTLLHEIQHAIQDRENWPTGGSPSNTPLYDADKVFEIRQHRKALGIDPEQVRGMIDSGQQVPLSLRERLNKFDDLLRQEKEIIDNKLAPIEAYRRLQGEAQARLTQDRIPLTMDQRREQYPLDGNKIADIPFNKLITRYGGSGDQRSIINQMAKGGKK